MRLVLTCCLSADILNGMWKFLASPGNDFGNFGFFVIFTAFVMLSGISFAEYYGYS